MNSRSRVLRFCIVLVLFVAAAVMTAQAGDLRGNTIFTAVKQIVEKPEAFKDSFVSLKATFLGWKADKGQDVGAPPVTRSDWIVRGDDGTCIYCTGRMPDQLRPDDPSARGRCITVLGQVHLDANGRPYVDVTEAAPLLDEPEQMMAVSQILFDPLGIKGRTVGLLGVLAKGFDQKGRRFYLLADPTGAIMLDRLPKLYPKGTILQLKGVANQDENGLPILTNVELVSAKP